MKYQILCIIISTLGWINLYSQEIVISIEERNKAIELVNMAVKEINNGNSKEAIPTLIESISIDSTFRPAYVYLYKSSILNNIFSESIFKNFKKSLWCFPEDDELYFYLAEMYRMNNQYFESVKYYTNAIRFAKINGEDFHLVDSYYFNRGNCYFKNDMVDSAIIDYEYSLKLNPDNTIALVNAGICYYKMNEIQKACEFWDKSLEKGNSDASTYLNKYCKEKPIQQIGTKTRN